MCPILFIAGVNDICTVSVQFGSKVVVNMLANDAEVNNVTENVVKSMKF